MNKNVTRLILALLVALLAAVGYYWWQQQNAAPAPAAPVTQPAPPVAVPAQAPAEPASAPAPTPLSGPQPTQYPIEAIETPSAPPAPALPALADADPYMGKAITSLLGRKNVLTFIQLDGFARRFVATVDNLTRSHVAPGLWPVNPTEGRFSTLGEPSATGQAINPDNSLRYTPFVLFTESIDPAKAVALYVQLYPLFQQTYEELGYPGRYFNDRLIAVLDHLLATPVPTETPRVALVDVKGPIASVRPWVRYEFVDPKLQAMSSGQKILLRMGPVNHRRLNAQMIEIRRLVMGSSLQRPKAKTP